MDAVTFYNMVAKMRDAQKEYFRQRTQSALVKSKELEKNVDAELQKIYMAKIRGEEMFTEDGNG